MEMVHADFSAGYVPPPCGSASRSEESRAYSPTQTQTSTADPGRGYAAVPPPPPPPLQTSQSRDYQQLLRDYPPLLLLREHRAEFPVTTITTQGCGDAREPRELARQRNELARQRSYSGEPATGRAQQEPGGFTTSGRPQRQFSEGAPPLQQHQLLVHEPPLSAASGPQRHLSGGEHQQRHYSGGEPQPQRQFSSEQHQHQTSAFSAETGRPEFAEHAHGFGADASAAGGEGRRSYAQLAQVETGRWRPRQCEVFTTGARHRHDSSPQSDYDVSSGMAGQSDSGPASQPGSGPPTPAAEAPLRPDKVFPSKADLQTHVQAHMREAKPYKCSQCSKAFANSSYLSQHTRIHLGIKPYRCEICQRKFTQLSHLQQHIRTHTGDKPYKCRHAGCSKAFSQLSNLQSHSRCHQTDKPYKCNSCYKCFTDENGLLEHIPKHKESKHLKTQICPYCGKSYTQETYLQKHMQKHADRVDRRPVGSGLLPPHRMVDNPYWPSKDEFDASGSASNCGSLQSPLDPTRPHLGRHPLEGHRPSLEGHRVLLDDPRLHGAPRDGPDGHRVLLEDPRPPIPHSLAPNVAYEHMSPRPAAAGSSAFTPIQSMASGGSGSGVGDLSAQMAPGQRYFYDLNTFPKSAAQEMKPAASAGGFISLHQISSYAQQRGGDVLGLKDKPPGEQQPQPPHSQ